MRSRRAAVDGDPWIYHVVFAGSAEGGTPSVDHGDADYITLSMDGGGDDPDYSNAYPIGPSNLTIWSAGLVFTDAPSAAQKAFMALDPLNTDLGLFPAYPYEIYSAGHLDPSLIDEVIVGARYALVNGRPQEIMEVRFLSDFGSTLEALVTLTGPTDQDSQGSFVRPATTSVLSFTNNADIIQGGAAPQTLLAGDGADTITVGSVQTDVFGEGGSDTITDSFGQSNLFGGSGKDTIVGGARDYIDGGADDDTITPGRIADNLQTASGYARWLGYIDGGSGNDRALFDFTADSRPITLTLTDASDGYLGSYFMLGDALALVSVERVEIRSGSGDDVLTAAGGNDYLFGGAGADTLDGGGGNDTLDGGLGGLAAGEFDTLIGGAGDDAFILRTGTEHVVEFAGEGTDTIQTFVNYTLGDNVENLTVFGTAAVNGTGNAGDNVLIGNAAANTLTGMGGNDRLDGRGGADVMVGGAGDDTFIVDNPNDKVVEISGGGSFDTVLSSVSYGISGTFIEILRLTGTNPINATGNGGTNIIYGNDAANVLTGLGGTDRLDGGKGADTMIGGTGDDTYFIDNAGDTVTEAAGEGQDAVYSSVTYSAGAAEIEAVHLTGTLAINATGTNGANLLYGNDNKNTLTGLGGNDRLDGGLGADTMIGGQGDDAYIVDNAADKVTELTGEGTDTVFAGVSYSLNGIDVEILRLTGGDPINATGNALANTLVGNAGANILDGKSGADLMIGGLGDDTYYVDSAGDRVSEKTGGGTDTVYSLVSFSLAETYVETLRLTGTAVRATGNSLGNLLVGNSANNTLSGLAGNDTLDGGTGTDTMAGGTGDDTYYVDNSADIVTEAVGEGDDTVFSSATFTLAGTAVETLRLTGTGVIDGTGNDNANTLIGNDQANVLTGLGGNDVIDGGKGADTMVGGLGDDIYYVDVSTDKVTEANGQGNDTVYAAATFGLGGTFVETLALTGNAAINGSGNSQANTLIGNAGANVLSGLGGADTLDGGLGTDTLTGGDGADSFRFSTAPAAGNADTITDFVSGTDRIVLDTTAFNEIAPGALPAAAFYAGTAAHDADDRFIYDSATGKLWFDDDGTGDDAAVLVATLAPGAALAAGDFVIV